MPARGGPLDGQHRVVVEAVVERHVEALGVALEPREVLLVVGGVGDGEVAVLLELVAEEVVEDASVLLGEDGVLRAVLGDLRHVVGEDPLQERLGAGAGGLDLAHVRDVEDPRVLAHREMLLADARVLDRHLPAGERDELGAGGDVPVVQGGSLERVLAQRPWGPDPSASGRSRVAQLSWTASVGRIDAQGCCIAGGAGRRPAADSPGVRQRRDVRRVVVQRPRDRGTQPRLGGRDLQQRRQGATRPGELLRRQRR